MDFLAETTGFPDESKKTKWPVLSLPTWKGHTALREESLTSRMVLEKYATIVWIRLRHSNVKGKRNI